MKRYLISFLVFLAVAVFILVYNRNKYPDYSLYERLCYSDTITEHRVSRPMYHSDPSIILFLTYTEVYKRPIGSDCLLKSTSIRSEKLILNLYSYNLRTETVELLHTKELTERIFPKLFALTGSSENDIYFHFRQNSSFENPQGDKLYYKYTNLPGETESVLVSEEEATRFDNSRFYDPKDNKTWVGYDTEKMIIGLYNHPEANIEEVPICPQSCKYFNTLLQRKLVRITIVDDELIVEDFSVV